MYISRWSVPENWRNAVIRLFCLALCIFLMLSGTTQRVGAQEEDAALRLRLRRDFGYGSGAQIQGRFSLIVDEAEDVSRVTFFVDDTPLGEDSEPPFRLVFSTGGYELGWHTLHAVGHTSDGRELTSNRLQRQFVSGNSSLIVVVAVVLLVVGFRAVSHFVTRDRSSSARKGYGMYGGAICPRCGRPFSRHWWAPNLLVGKLERCPSCGKWHFSTRATPQMLASAEQFANELDAEAGKDDPNGTAQENEELLRKRLDESRYEDD